MRTAGWVELWVTLGLGAAQLAWSSWIVVTRGTLGLGFVMGLVVVLACAVRYEGIPRAAWLCHTCGEVEESRFLWLARRRSIRHEVAAHGFSVYASPQDATPAEWARRQPQDA